MKIFYRPEMSLDRPLMGSFSARKPHDAVEDWLRRGLVHPGDILSFDPMTPEDFTLAHDGQMVRDVLELRAPNGYGTVDADLAATLPFTTGSLLAAARHALAHREAVCSPSSGFHHAHHAYPGGYCTFNGLVITAMKLKQEGFVNHVGILDLDMHYGDGTDDLIQVHGLSWILHLSQGHRFVSRADVGRKAQAYFDWLRSALERMRRRDLVLVQASADPHVGDPLGGLLNTEEMQQRDRMVFEALAGRAVAWNLAGGYQTDPWGGIETVLRLHRNTVMACQAAAQ